MTIWKMKHPQMTMEHLGFLPEFLSLDNPQSAREQLDANYRHGGGWQPFTGFTMLPNGNLTYPGDPETLLLAETRLRNEVIRYYQYSWVAIVQPDGSYEIARMD
jgi:hypothetical protein